MYPPQANPELQSRSWYGHLNIQKHHVGPKRRDLEQGRFAIVGFAYESTVPYKASSSSRRIFRAMGSSSTMSARMKGHMLPILFSSACPRTSNRFGGSHFHSRFISGLLSRTNHNPTLAGIGQAHTLVLVGRDEGKVDYRPAFASIEFPKQQPRHKTKRQPAADIFKTTLYLSLPASYGLTALFKTHYRYLPSVMRSPGLSPSHAGEPQRGPGLPSRRPMLHRIFHQRLNGKIGISAVCAESLTSIEVSRRSPSRSFSISR